MLNPFKSIFAFNVFAFRPAVAPLQIIVIKAAEKLSAPKTSTLILCLQN
jgi:hypothetical protein